MTEPMKYIKELKILAEKCASTDYADEQSVVVHNKNVDKIRKIIGEIETEEELLEVLKTKTVSTWGAFQYLETPENFSSNIINNAKKVLKLLSKESSIEAIVAKELLKK